MNQQYISVHTHLLEADLFKDKLKEVRTKGKKIIHDMSLKAANELQNELSQDLASKGLTVDFLNISLGKFRGVSFITSAKLQVSGVKSQADSVRIAQYLQDEYSPKFKLKNYEGVVANYNIR